MKKMIVNEHEIIFDSEDAHLIEGHSWAVTKNRNIFYARNGKQYMHRIVMNAKRGSIIDHINGNGLDNRKSNLRLASHQMNKANSTAKNSTSSFIGVSFKKERVSKPYRAMAKDNGKVKHLGYFRTEEEAARAYDTFVRTKYGEMAICNFKETESQNEMECQLCGQYVKMALAGDSEHTHGMDEVRGESDQRAMNLGDEYKPDSDGDGMDDEGVIDGGITALLEPPEQEAA